MATTYTGIHPRPGDVPLVKNYLGKDGARAVVIDYAGTELCLWGITFTDLEKAMMADEAPTVILTSDAVMAMEAEALRLRSPQGLPRMEEPAVARECYDSGPPSSGGCRLPGGHEGPCVFREEPLCETPPGPCKDMENELRGALTRLEGGMDVLREYGDPVG